MSGEIKRMRYETGLFLTEAEFNLEQQYHMRMRRLHNRYMHASGIVWGLEVVPTVGSYRVDIQPGMALDIHFDSDLAEESSREIIVSGVTTVDFTTSNYPPGSTIYLWIQYAEEESDISANAAGQSIHWLETFAVGHSLPSSKPDDEKQNVFLGKIVLDAGGKVASVSNEDENGNPIRLYAGSMTHSVQTDRLILSDDAIAESFPYLDGTLFLPEGKTGIEVNSQHTHITGSAEMEGDLKLNQTLLVSGKTYITNDVAITGTTNVTGDTNITGNLTITGVEAKIDSNDLLVKDSIVTLNHGESGTGVTSGSAGFDIDRGINQAKARLLFDETTDRFKAGLEGSESPLIRDVDLTYVRASIPTGGNQPIYIKRDPPGGNLLYWSDTPGGNWRPFA